MAGYKTVTASPGYEFKITGKHTGTVVHTSEYRATPSKSLEHPWYKFTDREDGIEHDWNNPTIELVKIEKPGTADDRIEKLNAEIAHLRDLLVAHVPRPSHFEFTIPPEAAPGDSFLIDSTGRWWLLRAGDPPYLSASGQAPPSSTRIYQGVGGE